MDRNESALYGCLLFCIIESAFRPTRIVTGSAGEVKGNDSKPQDAAGESRKRVDTQGLDAVASGGVNVSSHARNTIGGAISGTRYRPHCRHAALEIACQCAR